MIETSHEAIEALIAEASKIPLGSSYWSIVNHLSRSLAALLDERERLTKANEDIAKNWWLAVGRAERAERERERFKFALKTSEEQRLGAESGRDKLTAELDAYKRAKAENDDRFQIEASKHRERAERAEAKLDAVKAWATAEDKATEMSWSDYNCGRGDVAREALTFLADTDDVRMYWSNDADS